MPSVDFAVPGDPATRTGGYLYDRRIFGVLEALGWATRWHTLDSSFPRPTPAAVAAAAATLARIPAGRAVVIDGLALAGLGPSLAAETDRLRLIGLVHHPVALEAGASHAERTALAAAEAASLAAMHGVVVTSRWTARTLAAEGAIVAPIRVVEPGTDPVGPGTDPIATPRPRRHAADWRLLCVATLTPRKAHALLIEALAPLADRPWQLDCVGSTQRDPATTRAVRRRIRALGLEARIRLHGELDDAELEAAYRRADAFVLASELEGYGMALAEAVAHGLPVVGTTGGASAETVPAAAGLLVPPGDRDALTRALARLFDEPGLRARLERGALAARSALPTWQTAGERFAAAIAELTT